MTKKYKKLYILFTILSILCFIGPISFFTIFAFLSGTAIATKVALSSTILITIILSIIAAANKLAMRSRLWILLIGLFLCLDHIMFIVVVIGSCQIIDELIFSPLAHYYHNKFTINHEIDKRIGE